MLPKPDFYRYSVSFMHRSKSAFARRYDALMAEARLGVPNAAAAARRAAAMALGEDAGKAEQALTLATQLDPLDSISILALAQLRADVGDLDAAREAAARAFQSAIDESAKALAAFALGELALARGDRGQAKLAFEAAKRGQAEVLRHEPADYDALRHLGRAMQRLADFTAAEEGAHAGRIAHGEALVVFEALAQRDDALFDLAEDLAHGCARAAALCVEIGDHDGAQRCADARIGWMLRLLDAEPLNEHWRRDLADSWDVRAKLDLAARRLLQAKEASERALRLRVALAAAAPGDPRRRRALARAYTRAAEIAAQAGDIKAARAAAAQARTLREADDDMLGARALHDARILEGDLALKAGDLEPARLAYAHARETAEPLAQHDHDWRARLAQAWERLGEVALRIERFDAAHDAFARTRALLGQTDPRPEARLLLKEGEAAAGAGDHDAARTLLSRSCALRLDVLDRMPNDLALVRELAVALERLGLMSQESGDIRAARAAWQDELKLAQMIRNAAPDDANTIRFCAVVHGHLAGLHDSDAEAHRLLALGDLDRLSNMGQLSPTDMRLRAQLWGH